MADSNPTHPHQNHEHGHTENPDERARVQRELSELFEGIPYSVPLFLFSDNSTRPEFSRAARDVLELIKGITPKITFEEHSLDHAQAKKWGVNRAPAILFDPEHFRIRWLGAPLGEEGRILVQALLMIGSRSGGVSEASRKVLNNITTPRSVRLFVSMTCPYCPQQAVNILKAAVEKPDLISLEIVDIQANPDLAERYDAFSTPMTFVGDRLIARGAQSEELFMASLEKMEEQTLFIPEDEAGEIETDLVIVGGGPAGLSAGIYAARAGLNAAILERDILGGQVAATPEVENYPGISRIGGKTLVDIMAAHALEYCRIFPGEEALEIRRGDPVTVITPRRRFLTKVVLLATGARYRKLGIPGENRLSGRGVSYCATCDGPRFKGKRVLVAGGGNSAATEALHLSNIGVNVTLVHRRDKLRAQAHLADKIAADRIPVLWNSEITAIHGKERVEGVELQDNRTGENRPMNVNGVFIAIGYIPETRLARDLGIELTGDGYIRHDRRHRTSIPGIYSAGDVEGGFKQIVTAAAQGSEAAMAIFEDLVAPYWIK